MTTRRTATLLGVLAAACLGACGNGDSTDAGTPTDTVPAQDTARDTGTGDTVPGDTGDAGGGTMDGGNGTDGGAVADAGTCTGQGGQYCFELPTHTVNYVASDAGGPSDFSCPLPVDATAATAVTITGTVHDFQSGTALPGAMVAVFPDDNFAAAPLAMATSDTMGAFSFSIPAGTHNTLNWRTTAPMALDTYVVHDVIDVSMPTLAHQDRDSIGTSTANALPALIGMRRMPGTGVIAGEFLDCHRHDVSDAILTLSTTPSAGTNAPPTFVPGSLVYYFTTGSNQLPTRRINRTVTNTNGLFVILQVPPTTSTTPYYVQAWGFRTSADLARGSAGLSLLGETAARVLPDVLVTTMLSPRPMP